MDLLDNRASRLKFEAYTAALVGVIGHADRAVPLHDYCTGLLLPGERKSVEPMAARLAPDNVGRMHQSLHHLVADAPWSDEELLAQIRSSVLPAMCYQYGGDSERGLAPAGSPANWRCLAVDELSEVRLLEDVWRTAPNHLRPQACIAEADVDAEDQPDRDPQKGQ